MRYKVISRHGEGKTIFFVVDTEALTGDQPAVDSSFNTIGYARIRAEELERKERERRKLAKNDPTRLSDKVWIEINDRAIAAVGRIASTYSISVESRNELIDSVVSEMAAMALGLLKQSPQP